MSNAPASGPGAEGNLLIGLTGGIGSGKSTVAHTLVQLGAHLVDTDALSRQLTAPGGLAIPLLRERFGPEVIDAQGALDRARMRELAFSDPAVRQALEGILHPLIHEQTEAQARAAQPGQVIVFDVPLLAEAGPRWRDRVHRILVVDTPEPVQVERVMQRSGWSREMVERVIAQQASREQRAAVADDLILNHGLTLDELAQQVRELWARWVQPR